MRTKKELIFEDNDGLYIIVGLDTTTDVLNTFTKKISRNIIMESKPKIKDMHLFIDPAERIGYVVVFFDNNSSANAIENFARKLKRKYFIVKDINYRQLRYMSKPSMSRVFHIPNYFQFADSNSEGIIVWLAQQSFNNN